MSEPETYLLDDLISPNGPWRLRERADIQPETVTPEVRRRVTEEAPLKVAIVDSVSFTRECIDISISNMSGRQPYRDPLITQKFVSWDEMSRCDTRFDIIVYHSHSAHADSLVDLRKLTELAPAIVLSIDDRIEAVRLAFDNGARGYIPTASTGLDLLVEILHFVNAGGTFVPLSTLARSELPQKERQRLTEREMLILELLKKGKQNKVIAYELGLSESTVKVHIRHILDKLRARNRTEAVSAAMQATGQTVGNL
jgi:DNA-binding NarL/FixJ family response regulator